MDPSSIVFNVGALPLELQSMIFEHVLLGHEPIDEFIHRGFYQNVLPTFMSNVEGARNSPENIMKFYYGENTFEVVYNYPLEAFCYPAPSFHPKPGKTKCPYPVQHLILSILISLDDIIEIANMYPRRMEPAVLLTHKSPRKPSPKPNRQANWQNHLTQLDTLVVNMWIHDPAEFVIGNNALLPFSLCLEDAFHEYLEMLPNYMIHVRAREVEFTVDLGDCKYCAFVRDTFRFSPYTTDQGDLEDVEDLEEYRLLECKCKRRMEEEFLKLFKANE